jgi:hypothetical protein
MLLGASTVAANRCMMLRLERALAGANAILQVGRRAHHLNKANDRSSKAVQVHCGNQDNLRPT